MEEYYDWLVSQIDDGCASVYTKLLRRLHDTTFYYILDMDRNRMIDGMALRETFFHSHDVGQGCSMLEMMVALAIRCERIMYDRDIGDRTGFWFWGMVNSLGLGGQYDTRYEDEFVEDRLNKFMERDFDGFGYGSLFYVKDAKEDVRNLDIWYAMQQYLNSIRKARD